MASSYTTSFGIEKIGSGEQSGAWGTTTNHNLDILDRVASYKAVGLSGTTHTLTVREASPDSGTENLQDGMYRVIKFTGALGANNTVTIAPNTTAAYFIFINATTDSGSSGPYSVILTQGSGANITIPNGFSMAVYCDGAGSGAAIVDALSSLNLSGKLTVGGTVDINGNELILDADADTSITADTDDQIDIRIAGADDFAFKANSFEVQTGSNIDMNGTELILDADGDTSLTADTDDQIDVRIAGADDFAFKANTFEVQTGSNIDMNGTELILDADGDTSITADTDDQIDIRIAGADDFAFKANTFEVQTGSNIDMNGTELILDADGDTSLTADTDDQIDVRIAGADDFQFTANTFTVLSGSTLAVASGATIANSGTATGFGAGRAGRNMVINGSCAVGQRPSTTGVGGTDNTYGQVDRFAFLKRGSPQARATLSQADADGPNSFGFGKCLKVDCTTAESGVASDEGWFISQKIEGNNAQDLCFGQSTAKTSNLSFYISSPKSGTHCVAMYLNDTGYHYVREFTVASADTWERISVTFPGNTDRVITDDSGAGISLVWPLVAGSNFQVTADQWASGEDVATSNQQNLMDSTSNNFFLTGVQLEVGSSETDFEHEEYGETVEKCKRYTQVWVESGHEMMPWTGAQVNTTRSLVSVFYEREMRAAPSITKTDDEWQIWVRGTTGCDISSMNFDHVCETNARLDVTHASGGGAGEAIIFAHDGSGGTGRLILSAEI